MAVTVGFLGEERWTISKLEFLSDKSSCKGVVTGDHLNLVGGVFELLDDFLGVLLERALCDDEPYEGELALSLLSGVSVDVHAAHALDVLISQGENPGTILDVLQVSLIIIWWDHLQELFEDFWSALSENSLLGT